jgi:hypothetical protein
VSKRNKATAFLAFWLLTISTFMANTGLSQASSENGLVLRLLIPNPKFCTSNDEIVSEVVLRNTSSSSVTVPLGALGSGIHYTAYSPGDIHSPGLRTLDINADPWPVPRSRPPKEVTLRPGESYWVASRLALDHDFFSQAGIYDVTIDLSAPRGGSNTFVGPLESNRVYFELEDCVTHKSK